MSHSAIFYGRVKSATSSYTHPLQTIIEFVFTDFKPNKNGQAIPITEAHNIIASALHMPVKIQFDGKGPKNHDKAYTIGPIIACELIEGDDPYISAKAAIWINEYPEENAYLHQAMAANEQVGTSWELFYSHSERVEEVEWLHNVTVSGTAIVGNPAYGNRTLIRSVAETNMEEIEKLQQSLAGLMSMLSDFYYEAMELERAESAMLEVDSIAPKFQEILTMLKDRREKLASASTQCTVLQAQIATFEAKEQDRVATEKAEARKNLALSNGMAEASYIERKDVLDELSDAAFALYVQDFKPAKAEMVNVPNTLGEAKLTRDKLVSYLEKV